MSAGKKLSDQASQLGKEQSQLMPTLFVGHGSPMNLIDDNRYTRQFREVGAQLGKPLAILCISAHWITRGTEVLAAARPRQIYDFAGFPDELYQIAYQPPGAESLAHRLAAENAVMQPTTNWGLDHGTWAVLHHMYPDQDVPVFQLSLDARLSPLEHLALARSLRTLREQGVLILASGNIVHNLRAIDWNPDAAPHSWATDYETLVLETMRQTELSAEEKVERIFKAKLLKMAHPTVDHLMPLIYALGASQESEASRLVIQGVQNASVSMASVRFG